MWISCKNRCIKVVIKYILRAFFDEISRACKSSSIKDDSAEKPSIENLIKILKLKVLDA